MKIDPKKCVGCGNCVAVCPMGAIHFDTGIRRAVVNADECVECYTCFRGMSLEHLNPTFVRGLRGVLGLFRLRFDPEPDVCPTAAITPDELEWPRTVRRAFSDVQATHESTGILGRGTEEGKTNEIETWVDIPALKGTNTGTLRLRRDKRADLSEDVLKLVEVGKAETLTLENDEFRPSSRAAAPPASRP